jgi:hypothetical protein
MASGPDYAADGSTLTEILEALGAAGYEGQMAAREGVAVMCFSCRHTSPAADFTLSQLVRTEGASDPDDMAAVAALTCPNCGTRGTVVLRFGPEASAEDDDALRAFEDLRAT